MKRYHGTIFSLDRFLDPARQFQIFDAVFLAKRTTAFETVVILLAARVCSYAHFIDFLPLDSGCGCIFLYISGLCAHAPGAEEARFFYSRPS
jgi:hypothetical protein